MQQQHIYFMDFIEQHFKNPNELLKILSEKCDQNTWENIYKFLLFNKNINFVFDEYLVWHRDYQKLGFNNGVELQRIHDNWKNIFKKCKLNNGKVLFKKNINKLNIIFEGE